MNNIKLLDIANKNVVRIQCENIIQNIMIPYQKISKGTSFGSGFFISKNHILTNHHVIEYAMNIYINIPNIGKKQFPAKLACYSIENDYAILEIQNYNNTNKLFKIGNSHKIQAGEKLKVCGFPLGNINPNLKIVDGVVSGWERNKIQHDTNTNPGMSGGVILNSKNEAIGIHIGVISGKGWTNTAYAIPIKVININNRINMIKHNKNYPIIIKNPIFGFKTQISHNELIKSIIINKKHIKDGMGIVVTNIFSKFKTQMKSGDILFKVKDHLVDNYKDILFSCNKENKITYEYLTNYNDTDDKYEIIFYSKKLNKILKEKHEFKDKSYYFTHEISDINFLNEKIAYVNYGGILVTKLSNSHFSIFNEANQSNIVYKLLKYKNKSKLQDCKTDANNNNVLIVTHIYPSTSIYTNKIITVGSIIKKVNHKNVYTLTDYIKELKNSKKYAIITLDNNKIDIIDMENVDKLNIFLAQQYNYPLIKY